jgi:hypothetical protein
MGLDFWNPFLENLDPFLKMVLFWFRAVLLLTRTLTRIRAFISTPKKEKAHVQKQTSSLSEGIPLSLFLFSKYTLHVLRMYDHLLFIIHYL